MCVVSNIGDHYHGLNSPWTPNNTVWPDPQGGPVTIINPPQFTLEEVESLKKLLKAGLKADKVFGEKDCESPEKTAWLKEAGIDLEELKSEVDADITLEWIDSEYTFVDSYAYDSTGKRVAKIGPSGDGHYRASLYDNENVEWYSVGDYRTLQQAKDAVTEALDII